MSNLQLRLRRQIASYLSGKVDLPVLYRWVGELSWQIEHREPADADTVRAIELLLAECAHGDWNEDELKSHLRGFLGVVNEYEAAELMSDSVSETVSLPESPFSLGRQFFTAAARFADRSIETASA